jgi:hypothetical protein
MPTTSLIDIVDGGANHLLGDFAIRGATMVLNPIDAAKQSRRTVNGALVDLSYAGFRKYGARITCTDQEAPNLVGVFPGAQLTVTCLAQIIGPDPVTLTMRVIDLKMQRDEYGAETGWDMDLEEI